MAETITTITNAANLGGNASVVCGSPTKTALASGTLYVKLTVQLTAGAESAQSNLGSSVNKPTIEVYYCILPISLTANTTLPALIGNAANVMYCRLPMGSGNQSITVSTGQSDSDRGVIVDALFNNGGNLYTWFNSPPTAPLTNTPGTITIISVEF